MIVVDPNVVVSRYIDSTGTPALVIAAWLRGVFRVTVSEEILAECQRALNYERVQTRHRLTVQQIASDIAGFRIRALLVEPFEHFDVISADPTDNKVLACAVASGADYSVNGDRHLLDLGAFHGIRIVSTATFAALLSQANGQTQREHSRWAPAR